MKRLLLLLLTVAVIGCLTVLFVAARPVDFEKYDRTVEHVSSLNALNTALGETILQVRYGLLRNYDPLVRIMAESQLHAGLLQQAQFATNDPAIDARIAVIVEHLRRQEGWLHKFQSLNSILDNSLTYIPWLSHRLSELSLTPDAVSLQKVGEDLVVRLLRINDSAAGDTVISLNLIIARLQSQRWQTEADNLAGPVVDSLVLHARVIIRYASLVDATTAHLTDLTDNLLFDDLARALRDDYLRRVHARGRYRIALYALSILLVAAAGFLFMRLRRVLVALYRNKQTIEHKQVELADANRRLQDTVEELQNAQAQLIDASRKSGMAEVATAVLHNVGNVLNSVNASAELVGNMVAGSKIGGLRRAVDLLRQNEHQLASYLAADARGKHLPEYLEALADASDKERSAIGEELTRVRKNIDHIKAVVRRQQSHAKSSAAVVETLSFDKLVDDAIAIAANPTRAPHLRVRREYAALPPVTIDRHRVFQVVLNLLTNASQAVVNNAAGDGLIVVRIMAAPGSCLCLEVEDNGYGIPAGNLIKIFNHGFSTKKQGHGFGLHDSANATTELGGQLSAHSEGAGLGARFRLELPIGVEVEYADAS